MYNITQPRQHKPNAKGHKKLDIKSSGVPLLIVDDKETILTNWQYYLYILIYILFHA